MSLRFSCMSSKSVLQSEMPTRDCHSPGTSIFAFDTGRLARSSGVSAASGPFLGIQAHCRQGKRPAGIRKGPSLCQKSKEPEHPAIMSLYDEVVPELILV